MLIVIPYGDSVRVGQFFPSFEKSESTYTKNLATLINHIILDCEIVERQYKPSELAVIKDLEHKLRKNIAKDDFIIALHFSQDDKFRIIYNKNDADYPSQTKIVERLIKDFKDDDLLVVDNLVNQWVDICIPQKEEYKDVLAVGDRLIKSLRQMMIYDKK